MFSIVLAALFAYTTCAKAITGTNIGGWLVLEPWITPSLFYQFLDGGMNGTAMDSYRFCEVLGPVEGNAQMRAHLDTWYTEEHIKDLADRGVEMVRLPIGDWTLDPYGPYVGCMDGSADYIDWMYDTCAKYNISVLMDVHTAKGSQNGFDNGGIRNKVTWINDTHYSYDDIAEWMGPWDMENGGYKYIDHDNIQRSFEVSAHLLQRWGNHSAFAAYEPVNEPWWATPKEPLFDFYRKVRALVRMYAPQAKFVFHDSFIYSAEYWNDLFDDDDHDDVVMDHHYYFAFTPGHDSIEEICNDAGSNAAYANEFKYDVWFGEWALATDNCAHWLNGFNDGNPNNDFTCATLECPKTYMPEPYNKDFDRDAEVLGPWCENANISTTAIHKGQCFTDSLYFDQSEIQEFAKCTLESYNNHLEGQFLWTAHNEIEARWDYIRAWDMMWLNQTEVPEEQQLSYPDFTPTNGQYSKESLDDN